MIVHPALDLALNLGDTSGTGLLSVIGDRAVAVFAPLRHRLMRNDPGACRVRAFVPSAHGPRAFEEVNLAGAIVRVALGIPDRGPTAGAYPLAVGAPLTSGLLVSGKRYLIAAFVAGDSFTNVGAASNATGVVFTATTTTPNIWTNASSLLELTSDLSVGATAAMVATALNATAAITAAGGVTVTTTLDSQLSTLNNYWVTFNLAGPQPAIAGPLVAGLTPKSIVSVSRVEPGLTAGLGSVREVQLIRLLANPYCFATLTTVAPAADAVVEEIQPATQDFPARYRLTLDPAAYDGHAIVTLDGNKFELPWNASRSHVQFLAGASYKVEKYSAKAWDISGVEPAQDLDLSATVTGLVVPGGVSGFLNLNTVGIHQDFAASAAAWLPYTLAVDIQFPGEQPRKVYQDKREVHRDLIDLNSIVPATMLSLQFVASNFAGSLTGYDQTLTALRAGPTSLESKSTAGLVFGYMQYFYIGSALNIWRWVTGAANVADLDGQVAALDTVAGHWERSGL